LRVSPRNILRARVADGNFGFADDEALLDSPMWAGDSQLLGLPPKVALVDTR
jgi:hypothetical protein